MTPVIDICPVEELPPGDHRLVEWEDLEIGVFNCAGELLAIEDRCSHDDGVPDRGRGRSGDLYRRVPAARVGLRPAHRKAAELARVRPRRHLPGVRGGRRDPDWRSIDPWRRLKRSPSSRRWSASTPTTRASSASTTPRPATPSRRRRASRPSSSSRSPSSRTSRSGCSTSASRRYEHFLSRPQPTWGSPFLAEVDYDNIHYFVRASEKSSTDLGRRPRRHQEHVRQAGHPGGRAQVPLRRRRPVRVRGRLPPGARGPREAGRRVHGHGLRPARARGPRARVLRDDHPVERQQARGAELRGLVGRLVRLRPAGRARRDAAAGLLPHQHREHGPVRADADHRRRGLLRALRRGLHGADLVVGLAALRGGRADRQAGRADPLHDRAELVAERLQPRHQARDRRDRRDRRVGRLQPRLEADDEVPERLPDGRARPRRGALDRVRRQRPAPGRGREDHPRGAEHDVEHLRQVDLQGRRALLVPRPARGRQGRPRRRGPRSSATRCCSTRTRARTPTRRSASARTTSTSATRRRSPRSARSSSST